MYVYTVNICLCERKSPITLLYIYHPFIYNPRSASEGQCSRRCRLHYHLYLAPLHKGL
ncbi:hypothetical protein HanIR_Chr17g0846851 [Helianthus annuus]|nr:hypothetical protein HanIR_Chr17g0846851 [Helianthus annuus]